MAGVDRPKIYVAGSLSWLKHDNHGNLLGGATFEVCRTHELNTSVTPAVVVDVNPDVCVTVVDKTPTNSATYSGLDTDADAGEFKLQGLDLGTYTVRETIPPLGYDKDLDTETVNLTVDQPDGSVTTPFVDIPQYRIVVFACNQAGGLALATATADLTTGPGGAITLAPKDTLGTLPSTPAGLTADQICNYSANFPDLPPGTYTLEVVVPK